MRDAPSFFPAWSGVLLLAVVAAAVLAGPRATAAPNPVLIHTADSGVLRHGGRYYLMGVGTNGHLRVSDDLVNWGEPVHALSMDNDWATGLAERDTEIHACDFFFHNGVFHLYWSVNQGKLRQIGHAVASSPLGPYKEPVTTVPFDGRIDPHLFADRDGSLYFYTVKFTQGNTIWGQPMADPWTLDGEPLSMLTALADTWECQDHRVNEAPEVVGWRDRYYLLYNANHTGERFGHYGIGVAESDTPLGFENAGKYPYPLLDSNRQRILSESRVLVPPSIDAGQPWRCTETAPAPDWAAVAFDDASWAEGEGAFGNPDAGMARGQIRTPWRSKDLWLRRRFTLDEPASEYVQVFTMYDGILEVFLNGVPAYGGTVFRTGYVAADVSPEARAALRVGENVLAVHVAHDGQGAQYVDAGLIDPRDHPGEPVVHNAGQPNLVRGPNGFEWWLVYFALHNGSPARNQCIDRAHFLGDELYVEGPTTARTRGHHPGPARPTFRDLFDEGDTLSADWCASGGTWRVHDGIVTQEDAPDFHAARLAGLAGTHHLIETGVRIPCEAGHRAGLVAWHGDDRSRLRVGLDKERGTWFYEKTEDSAVFAAHFELAAGFAWDAWHTFRVEKNGGSFVVLLDGIPAPGAGPIETPFTTPGEVGIWSSDGPADFTGFTYTRGWDEWGLGIRDWTAREGAWHVTPDGLVADGPGVVLKGDALERYEFAAQVDPEQAGGIVAAWVGEGQSLRVTIDAASRNVRVRREQDGEAPWTRTVPIRRRANVRPGAAGVNLRVVRQGDHAVLFADGVEHLVVSLEGWPASAVGLVAEGGTCRFNGLTRFDLGAGTATKDAA